MGILTRGYLGFSGCLHPVGSRWCRHSSEPPDSRRSCTSAKGRKRSFDACARVVRHNASHRETTIRTKREEHRGLAGRRIAGGRRKRAQVSELNV
jgi:hypothetical protein